MAHLKKTAVSCILLLAGYIVLCPAQANECYPNKGCPYLQYCCNRKYDYELNLCQSSCVGLSCNLDDDCAPGEYCCGSDDKCALDCIGESCSQDSDCANGESCCGSNGKCALDCIEQSCSYDGDCAKGESCCQFKSVCRTGGCNKSNGWPLWLVPTIAVTTVSLFIFIIACVIYRRCYVPRKRRAVGDVIVVEPANRATTAFAQPPRHGNGIPRPGQPMYQNRRPQRTAWILPSGKHAAIPSTILTEVK